MERIAFSSVKNSRQFDITMFISSDLTCSWLNSDSKMVLTKMLGSLLLLTPQRRTEVCIWGVGVSRAKQFVYLLFTEFVTDFKIRIGFTWLCLLHFILYIIAGICHFCFKKSPTWMSNLVQTTKEYFYWPLKEVPIKLYGPSFMQYEDGSSNRRPNTRDWGGKSDWDLGWFDLMTYLH